MGQRVVVRRVLPGVTGPTGGPALTDVLGTCTAWGDGRCVVRRDDAEQTEVVIRLADIVSGKPVPPRPDVFLRVADREPHLHALARWPGTEHLAVGEWVLRAAGPVVDRSAPRGRLLRRANSALAMGDPGLPVDEAAARVREFYAVRDQPALAQVVSGGDVEESLTALGWGPATAGVGGPGDALLQLAPVSRVGRALRGSTPSATDTLRTAEQQVDGAADGAADARTASVALEHDGSKVAAANVLVDGDWMTVDDLWVAPEHRRTGLARQVLAEALDWAASYGARTACLAVTEENHGARALYEQLGFVTHHAYRYLSPAD